MVYYAVPSWFTGYLIRTCHEDGSFYCDSDPTNAEKFTKGLHNSVTIPSHLRFWEHPTPNHCRYKLCYDGRWMDGLGTILIC